MPQCESVIKGEPVSADGGRLKRTKEKETACEKENEGGVKCRAGVLICF